MRQKIAQWTAIIASLLLPATTLAAPTTSYKCTTTNNCAVAKRIVLDAGSNNPLIGNEWQYLGVKNADLTSTNYTRSATVQDGERLVLRIYIDNNANPQKVNPSVAQGVSVHIPLRTQATSSLPLYSSISYGGATSQKISDTIQLTASQPFVLKEVPKSAKLQWADVNATDGQVTPISDNITAGGASIGSILAGFRNSILLTVTVQVHMTSTTTHNTAGKTGGAATPSSGVSSSHTFGSTGGIAAPTAPQTPAPTPTSTPATTPATPTTPATTTPAAITPAVTTPPATTSTASTPASTPTSGSPSTSQSTPTTPTTPRVFNVVQTPAAATTTSASTGDQTASSASSQSQPQTTTLPDTGNTSATSETLGLTLMLVGLGFYYRSRQSLGQRQRRSA
jgi:LPXTG-motif cell wall-anchored protein